MPPRQSPSNQNQSGKARPQTPMGGNQQVPQAAGNPRYQSGLGPDPNPKVVVKTVNPPITPDQVVSLAEQPSSAIELPNIKLQNIKIPPVKNKTIQGHLKAIEAKMTATEKLMKDVVKLQRLQIKTEKEIYERKRELYQNTFEEYIYDKTIDFEDPEDPDCTCINLPKGPKRPGGGRRGGGGGTGVPVPVPGPPRSTQEEAEEPTTTNQPVQVPTTPGNDIVPFPRKREESEEIEQPIEEPAFNFLDLFKVIPFLFGPLFGEQIAEGSSTTTPLSSFSSLPFLAQDLISGQPFGSAEQTETFLRGTPGTPSFSPQPGYFEKLASYYFPENQPTLYEAIPGSTAFANLLGQDPKMMSNSFDMATMFLGPGFGTQVPSMVTNPALLTAASKSPFLARLCGLAPMVDDAVAQIPAGKIGAERLRADPLSIKNLGTPVDPKLGTKIYSNLDMSEEAIEQIFRNPNIGGMSPKVRSDFSRQLGSFTDDAADALVDSASSDPDLLKLDLEDIYKNSGQVGEELDGVINIIRDTTKNRASGGMGSMDLYNSGAKQYFRKISNDMNIPKFGGGGFNLFNPMSWFSGDVKKARDGELENVSNDTFAGKLYNRRRQQEEMLRKLRGYQSGGIVDWWNMGRNVRVPAENSASWRTLMADDARQITRSNKAFRSGATGIRGWNPIKAFTPEMVRTGPTPAVRQAFERPVRFVRDQIVRSAVSSVVRPLVRPLIKPLLGASALILATPSPAGGALYGPGAVDPRYRNVTSREEFDKLEAAQNSMMSGSNNQQPQIMPLPPDYIKIPGKTPPKQMDTFVVPGIDKPSSMFTRSTTFID